MTDERVRTTDTGRVEAFSDGVLAIALTLLVLDLIAEHTDGKYAEQLLQEWPTYLAYVAAFLTIASIWLSHHDAFSRLARVDPAVRILNLGLLLGVALVPWPTALISAALAEPGPGSIADQRAAVAVYVVVSLIVAVGWSAMSGAIAKRPQLVEEPEDIAWFRMNARFSRLAGVAALAGGLLGWFAPIAALVVFLLVPAAFFAITLAAARRAR